MRKRISEIHPIFFHSRIQQKRIFRRLSDLGKKFAAVRSSDDLPFTVKRHQSLLRRKLGNSDPQLQENKVVNLGIACPTIDGIMIRPGEIFSFWHRVGRTTAEKGYVEGMQLSRGEVVRGVGGGLCQLANLLYWMTLHTPMQVIERHHHSFDAFPDEGRTLPFGSGAGVFYNYIDLRFFNPTEFTFQFRLKITDGHLKGAVFASEMIPNSYHIFEKNHAFVPVGERIFRENEIWRETIDRRTGNIVSEELLVRNRSEVKYELNLAAQGCNV